MPQIRGDQLKNLTIMDAQVSDYAKIRQHKIDMDDATGWISAGILRKIQSADQPNWDGTQNGRLYYFEDTQELVLGTNSAPFYTVIGKKGGSWNVKVTRRDGKDATDWNGSKGTEYTSSVPAKADGSNMLVYINGVLHRPGANYDYTLLPDNATVKFNYDIADTDVITIVIYTEEDLTLIFSEYISKAELALPTSLTPGASLVGVGPIQNIPYSNLQDVLAYVQYELDHGLQQYDHYTLVKNGIEAEDWDGTHASTFSSAPSTFAVDGSNLFVYYNGQLQKLGASDDYVILDATHIQFTFLISAIDRVTITVMENMSLSSYASYASLASSISGYSGAAKIGLAVRGKISSNDVQSQIETLSTEAYSMTQAIGIDTATNRVGLFNQTPRTVLDIDSQEKVYSKNGVESNGGAYSQLFKSESNVMIGDLTGVNLNTGYVRRYQNGDEFVGVATNNSAFLSNFNFSKSGNNTWVEVCIKGKVSFDANQVNMTGRKVFTKDGIKIGVMLADGDLFL